MSITRRTDASDEWKRIKYVVFDAPKVAGGIRSRLEVATEVLQGCDNDYAMIHPHTLCEGVDHLLEALASMEQAGGEGMMLRHASASHRGGRNVDLLKVKSFHDDEAIVTDYEAGKGKYTGRVGSLVCRSRQGAAFKVGSGLVDSQRSYQSKTLPPIGSVITFQYFELTKDNIPRFPTFLRIRPDVDAAEFN
jgi:DNA ligase 1